MEDLRQEVIDLRLWNSSMMYRIQEVHWTAANWIRMQVQYNKEAIESYELWLKNHQFNISQGD